MTYGVDDDFGFRRFVEDHIGIAQGRHAPNGWIVVRVPMPGYSNRRSTIA
jgi:hypothetical protein